MNWNGVGDPPGRSLAGRFGPTRDAATIDRITTHLETSGDRTGTLRGAGVEADFGRVGRVAASLCLASLAVLAVVFFVTGARKNAQITSLRTHGVAVEVTITRCTGLLGGSGSNGAGYACRGTYVVDGRRQVEAIPGDVYYSPGTVIPGVTVASDPGLLSTAHDVEREHASWKVFILPTVLLVLLPGTLLVLRLRRGRLLWRG